MTKIQLTTGDVLTVSEDPYEIKGQSMINQYIEVREIVKGKDKKKKPASKPTFINPIYIVWFE